VRRSSCLRFRCANCDGVPRPTPVSPPNFDRFAKRAVTSKIVGMPAVPDARRGLHTGRSQTSCIGAGARASLRNSVPGAESERTSIRSRPITAYCEGWRLTITGGFRNWDFIRGRSRTRGRGDG